MAASFRHLGRLGRRLSAQELHLAGLGWTCSSLRPLGWCKEVQCLMCGHWVSSCFCVVHFGLPVTEETELFLGVRMGRDRSPWITCLGGKAGPERCSSGCRVSHQEDHTQPRVLLASKGCIQFSPFKMSALLPFATWSPSFCFPSACKISKFLKRNVRPLVWGKNLFYIYLKGNLFYSDNKRQPGSLSRPLQSLRKHLNGSYTLGTVLGNQ